MNIKLIFLFLSLIAYKYISSQEIERELVSSSGKTDTIQSVIIEYSIGESIIEHGFIGVNKFNNGFQQKTFTIQTGIVDADFNDWDIHIYPNPTEHYFILECKPQVNTKIVLYDMLGKVVYKSDLKNEKMQIDVSQYAVGAYNIQIISNEKSILKNYKLIKN